ncbi:MAG: response regulator [Gammaproteobacteria bacterium]|nr:response regulator [Gammaproteobacteria bacterium]
MKLFNSLIIGELTPHNRHLMHETQMVRVRQSLEALKLVVVTGVVYVWSLWDESPSYQLLTWMILIFITSVIRGLICKHIEKNVKNTDTAGLIWNEKTLFWTSLLSTTMIGSGYWWVYLEGTDRAINAVAILTCIYAIGTTINSSIQYRSFPTLLISNIGQGCLFFFGVGGKPGIALAIAMGALLMLLLVFGKRNSEVFSESIRMRDLNIEQNKRLEQDKILIQQALKEAKEADQAKSRFLAAASHDLRQPLHALTLFLGSLRQTVSSETSFELIEKIDQTSRILREQFNSLLDLSKFDAGGVEVTPSEFRIDELLQRLGAANVSDANAKGVDLYIQVVPSTVSTDELLIERLISNLVTNAVRYTESGNITLSCHVEDGYCTVSIRDTGPGIDPIDQERIFEDFTQLNNPARNREQGTGLGLAIVRRIATLLQLDLILKSNRGEGSTFELRLPHLKQTQVETAPTRISSEKFPMESAIDLNRMRVMVVDDDPQIVDALSMQLSNWNCEVWVETSYERALDGAQQFQPIDLALIDDMPGEKQLSGLDLALALRKSKKTNRSIIITGNVLESRLSMIRQSGFDVYTKPMEISTLLRILQSQ